MALYADGGRYVPLQQADLRDPPPPKPGWSAPSMQALADMANSKGGVALLMLAVFVGWESGWIPSNSKMIREAMTSHVAQAAALEHDRKVREAQVLEQLIKMADAAQRGAKVTQIRVCAEVKDPGIQATCLAQ